MADGNAGGRPATIEYRAPVGYDSIVRVALDEGAHLPVRAHSTDAGADIRCIDGFTVPARGSVVIDTGVHVQLPPNTKLEIKSKSGLNVRHGIITTGLIDEGFTGKIIVRVYNLSDEDYEFEAGDKVTQVCLSPVLYPHYEYVDAVRGGERGDGGYGSTGR